MFGITIHLSGGADPTPSRVRAFLTWLNHYVSQLARDKDHDHWSTLVKDQYI